MESTGPSSNDKQSSTQKMCLACNQTFGSTLSHCPNDGTQLVPFGHDDNLGKVINGRFKVIEMIGKGGMGSVYLAEDFNQNNAYVAIKMLHAQLSEDKVSVKRFQQEASAAADLQHPNLIQQFDYGMIDEKQPFLVMEFLEGDSLAQILRENGPLTPPRALRIFAQVMDGLHYAHNKGVVHRDIKPSNILLLQKTEGEERVKVLDFGLAKLMPWSGKESQHLTKTGEVFGSPIYMSPEQCMGKPLEPSSDIYSLGITLFESLTGRPPFRGQNVVQTASKHLSDSPPPFETFCPELNLPLNLQAVVFKALEKDATHRYLNMTQFKDALTFAVTGQGKGGVHIQAAMNADATQQVKKVDLDSLRSSSHNFGPIKIEAKPSGLPSGLVIGGVVALLLIAGGAVFFMLPKSSTGANTSVKAPAHNFPQKCEGTLAYIAVKPGRTPRQKSIIKEAHLLTSSGLVKLVSNKIQQKSAEDLQLGGIWKADYKGDESRGELSKFEVTGSNEDLVGACNMVENFYRYLAEKEYMNVYDMFSEKYLKSRFEGLSREDVVKKLSEEYKHSNLRLSGAESERVSVDGSVRETVLASGERIPLIQSMKIESDKPGKLSVLVDSRFYLKKPEGIQRFGFSKSDRFMKIEKIETAVPEKIWETD